MSAATDDTSSSVEILFLPPELLLHIMSFTRPDIRTLKTCSIVSKLWQSLAQSLLFASITIYSSVEPRSPASLVEVLDRRPDLAPFVRHLNVKFRPPRRPALLYMAGIRVDKLSLVLSRLPHLDSLSLKDVTLTSWKSTPSSPTPASPSLISPTPPRKLQIKHVSLQTVIISQKSFEEGAGDAKQTLLAFIALFSSILKLSLHEVRFNDDVSSPHADDLGPTHVLTLEIEPRSSLPFHSLQVMQCVPTPDVVHLRVKYRLHYNPLYYGHQQQCIDAAACIERMEINMPSRASISRFLHAKDAV